MNKQIRSESGICHFRSHEKVILEHFLSELVIPELSLSANREMAAQWLFAGCVYVNGQRQRTSCEISPEDVVRLHTRPKRYKTGPLEVHAETEDFLILDKPAGMPTHPTLDNFTENAKYLLESQLGYPLFTTHRLDIPTQGLLLFAKNPFALKRINKLFALGRVSKFYQAHTQTVVPCALYTHFIEPVQKAPRPISTEAQAGWWKCQLEVIGQRGLIHDIRLLTGKTHQIRAQFSSLGAPIDGDQQYGSNVTRADGGIALACMRLAFEDRGQRFEFIRSDIR